jgi:hypothetical protein
MVCGHNNMPHMREDWTTKENQVDQNYDAYDREDDEDDPDDGGIVRAIPNRLAGEVKRLTCEWNPNPMEHAEMFMLNHVVDLECATIAGFDNRSNVPKTYYGAKNHKDWKDWWAAMCTKFTNMELKGVWEIIPRSNIPTN